MNESTSRERIAEHLRGHGIMPTHQRMEIAQVLFEREDHLSADQVLARVNARHAETSKATVYNTLRLFVEKKLLRELVVDAGKVVYDSNAKPHQHIYNVLTGELTDIPGELIKVEGLPSIPDELQSEGVDVIVRVRPRG